MPNGKQETREKKTTKLTLAEEYTHTVWSYRLILHTQLGLSLPVDFKGGVSPCSLFYKTLDFILNTGCNPVS